MSAFRTLFMMQLKEKSDTSYLKSFRKTLFRVLFAIFVFAAVMAVAYVVFFLCMYLRLFSALGSIPSTVMAVIFFVMLVFTMVSSTISLCKTLFQSSDNQMLLTFPVSASAIFMSKICVAFVTEAKKTFYFLIPIFFAYAIVATLPWYSYIWIFVMFMVFTAFIVMVSAFLALPVHYIYVFFKRFRAFGYVLGIILIVALVALMVWAIGLIPDDLNLITSWSQVSQYLRRFLSWFYDKFYFCYAFVCFMCGTISGSTYTFFSSYSYIVLLVVVGSVAVFGLINYAISRYGYAKVAGRQFEYNKKRTEKKKRNKMRGHFLSTLRYDGKRTLLEGNLLTSLIAVVIITPVSILFLNALFAAISKRLLGEYLAISFNILIILLFAMSSNVWVSAIYSKDGESLALYKTRPRKAFRALSDRLIVGMISTFFVVLPSTIILFFETRFGIIDAISIVLTELFVAVGHLLWSAEIDYMNPKPHIFQTSGNAGINPNEIKSIALSLVLSLAAMGVFIFFLVDGSKYAYLKILAIAAIFFAYRLTVFRYKAGRFYEEGQS